MFFEAIILDKLPAHDTCWSLITGADNHIYIAACVEGTPGFSAVLARYNSKNKKTEYLLDIGKAVKDSPESGRATQCKLHYSLLSDSKGLIYGATHLSGPPKGSKSYSPWQSWNDPVKCFLGSMLFIYDPKKDSLLWTGMLAPKEGCRCLAFDEGRGKMYFITYPRNHFCVFDLKTKEVEDLGRIGNVNPQAIFLDAAGNAYTTTDSGRLIRYSVERKRLEELDVFIPAAPHCNVHNVLYDALLSPDGAFIYGVSWALEPRLFRYRPGGTKQREMEDLGSPFPAENGVISSSFHHTHIGGLTFGKDGLLYLCANEPKKLPRGNKRHTDNITLLYTLDPVSGDYTEVAKLSKTDKGVRYISRGCIDKEGTIYFADVGNTPTRIYRYKPDYPAALRDLKLPVSQTLRKWG
ncbi:MAG: hypothetical protein WCI43_04340 [Candidatus Firestonebacteria bacterium]